MQTKSKKALALMLVSGGLMAAAPAVVTPALASCTPSAGCNACAAKKCSPCAASACNPCAAKCNPCAAKGCNPCAAKCNPCAANKS